MADTLSFLSVAAFVIAGVSLAAAVFFWFFFQISSVIGDLSGRNAKRSIEKMRAANAKTGNKIYRGSKFNSEWGEETGLTERIIPDMQATELLKEETAVRLTKAVQNQGWNRKWSVMLDDIMLIHTDETLE